MAEDVDDVIDQAATEFISVWTRVEAQLLAAELYDEAKSGRKPRWRRSTDWLKRKGIITCLALALLIPPPLPPQDLEARAEGIERAYIDARLDAPQVVASVSLEPLPPVVAPLSASGVEQWRSLVEANFPSSQVDAALSVMACESGGDPGAYNPSGASGLMQILSSWADDFGLSPDDLFDPAINLNVAAQLYADGGWGHWAQCT